MDDDLKNWYYVLNHVFFPPKLPQKDDFDMVKEHGLSVLVQEYAQAYKYRLPIQQQRRWESIIRMLKNLSISQDSPALSEEFINKSIGTMIPGDTLALLIHEQNAGLIMRKFTDKTIFESFEVSPLNATILGAKGKLICSYPGPAIAVPSETVDNPAFCKELASFLMQMDADRLDSAPTTTKAGSTVTEIRDTAHPRYITQLLTGILRGMGEVAEITRIRKRIGDDVLYNSAKKPWRRSPLWLVIRVALQTSLHEKHSGHTEYKSFMAFMMARMLRSVLGKGFSSDNLFFMSGKISRRLYKLGSAVPGFVLQEVQEVGQATEVLLQKRWTMVQNRQATSAHWAPDDLDIHGDTYLSLPNSESYILRILDGKAPQRSSDTFQPEHHSRYQNTRDFCAFESNDGLSKAFAADSLVALADFELAIHNHLDDWVADNLFVQSACITVASCITQYSESALKLYDSNPENQSIMILTVFHLWVALDRIAVAQCPLLQDYSPEVPLGLLEPLLLRRSSMFEQLASIEEYLRERHRRAFSGWSVFTDDVDKRTFAVRYVDASTKHQTLQSHIESAAREARQKKIQELQSKNAEYRDLVRRYEALAHTYSIDTRGRSHHKKKKCQRCLLETQAGGLQIAVHEWPLPQNPLEAKVAVFELKCPLTFGTWRTTTYQVLHDICATKSKGSANPPVKLENYCGFQPYPLDTQVPRITLASTTKSFLNSHYKNPRIPSDEASVCLHNGLQFRLFDKFQDSWVANPFTECSIVRYCTLQLPKGRYGSLQYTVNTTLHTSNQVLADQSECHQELNLHEYIAFSSLRSGSRLQWLNMAREIRARSLSFCREEVHILITQTAWQIGHLSSNDDWEWHAPLSDVGFGFVLLRELGDLILSVEANWLEVVSVRTVTALASRLLASQNDAGVTERVYALLRKARAITFRWMHQLAKKLRVTEDEDKVRELQQRICEVAATCRGTYDVDPDHVPFLLRSNEDVAILVECAIAVYDNTPSNLTDCPLDFKRLLDRDRRLSHSLELSLRLHIRKDRGGLDHAIGAIWTGYRPGSDWKTLQPPNNRWLIAMTATEAGQESQPVQLNLLEGRLLINGKPLGRLPQNIVTHPTYSRIFGQKILDVIPADIPGMDFATRSLVSNHQVFFTLRHDTQLVIRARHESKMLELIPHDQLVGDLPTLLVEKYTHWLDLSNGEIELRPIEDRWGSSTKNWRIHVSANGRSRMSKDSSLLLVDIHSPAFRMISARLKPLEYADHLITTCSLDDHSVSVELPRFRLSFFLNDRKDLECQNMPGMIVDPNQSTGTMFGLSSQLVLRTKNPVAAELPRSRRVIIPFGQVHFEPLGDHVGIVVDTHALSHVKYHEYKIDTDLGCLVGTVSLISKLYKIYLHSISSHCLPDPLTARTGTEEALHELHSASCRSFQKLGADEEDMLHNIGSLTPARTFYPPHLKVMQSVKWADLGTMAQHHGFYMVTQSILEHAKRLHVFHGQPGMSAVRRTYSSNFAYLSERAGRRSAVFYPADCAGTLPHTNADIVHSSRDLATVEAADEALVCNVSAMVNHWPTTLNISLELFKTLNRWGFLSGGNQELSLSYSRDWLQRDLPKTWISLYELCRGSSRVKNGFELVFSLSSMAYSIPENRAFIPTLMAFATIPQFRTLSPPPWPHYDLTQGFRPRREELLNTVRSFTISFESSPEANLPAQNGESKVCLGQRRFSAFEVRRESQVHEFVDSLIKQWPCKEPDPPQPPSTRPWLFETRMLMPTVKGLFTSWFSNQQLRDHIDRVQAILNGVHGSPLMNTVSLYQFTSCLEIAPLPPPRIVLDRLFERDAPHITLRPPNPLETPELRKTGPRPEIMGDLPALISHFQHHGNSFYRRYGNALDESRRHLVNDAIDVSPNYIPYSMEILTAHRDQCKVHVEEFLASLNDSLSPSNPSEMMMYISGLWPRITLRSLLGKLAFHSSATLTNHWQSLLISLAEGMLLYQSSQRLLWSALKENHDDFSKELKNQVCRSQDAKQCLDWLLIQVDNNFLARPIQIHVAQQMIDPDSGKNMVLQLNMGEGKSSVIVPMVAVALADGEKLVRVVVLKSLAGRMFQLLVERLSGLANRQVFYMPFSRSVKLEAEQAQLIRDLYNDCMRVGGILVVQPEHILSYKLMGIERLFSSTSSTDRKVADEILASQRWLEERSRDVLDESDEILHVRYQLIYTMGQQRSLEDHPDRWTTAQQVFSLVEKHTPKLQKRFPMGVEVQESRHGGFPPLRILHLDAGKALVSLIAKDVLDGALPNCPYGVFSRRVRRAALRMITEANISKGDAEMLTTYCEGSGSWKGLLLLRGLLAQGLLVYVLKERRWRVDYGLDPSRSLLAVPYRAKDIPALRAEFGHPDVAVVLTCLSYYYGGLSDDQLDLCFQLLYKLDNPTMEYEKWVYNEPSVPLVLHQLSGVNIRDPEQRKQQLFPLFRHNRVVIDFYLSQVVFPKEAKEFPKKLTTSGWDIAESKRHITTGFSGTNDNQYLLPTSITQRDPLQQLSTNAKVLSYLLQPENNHYICVQNEHGERLSAQSFLELLVKQTPEIRILLDVGAQMLEMRNVELAKHWLSLKPDVPAVIYFEDNDQICVLTRDGTVETFISSPFNQRLDKCLVYLDDVHTRGTDLKLPRDSRAAVTLGPKVTKDRLLQGCMRMRRLGHGQSVMFFAPLEVHRTIQEGKPSSDPSQVEVRDILRWTMLETCADIQHHVPHWAEQGVDHKGRESAWLEFVSSGNSSGTSVERLKSSWLQPEAQTLEKMYGLPLSTDRNSSGSRSQHAAFDIPELRKRCQMLGVNSFTNIRMEEEQEREVDHEAEKERQVERPPKAEPATHAVHKDVRQFVQTGLIRPLSSSQFLSVFSPLEKSFAAPPQHIWSPNLLATKDFSTTIQNSYHSVSDYLRPVHWIVSSFAQGRKVFVILSPYEVNELLPEIHKSKEVHLHIYSPKVTQSMRSFDDLKFFCIPPLPSSWVLPRTPISLQLNLWAGQLYLPDYQEYLQLCGFLGIYTKELQSVGDISIQLDGFIRPEHRENAPRSDCPFTESPVPFLKELIGLRRKGMGFTSTHVGKILYARPLTEEDFKD
ncbi:hypothetical protein PILCRDRAFT_819766 [Piloderma croceum F 1598]|uniref:ubiquitinyl hydrolase 1 n=1 Tax=Piloderma croceum (strain F 1598) TaxID=765440 RepID=A0A0C3FER3_PILCF|nr:hypothetical protein PILCRDRAFT_819766 [Piloderma croceum F 1598]